MPVPSPLRHWTWAPRLLRTGPVIWTTVALYLLICGSLIGLRIQLGQSEDALRRHQQLISQNILVTVFEANKAAIVAGTMRGLSLEDLELGPIHSEAGHLRRQIRSHIAAIIDRERTVILDLAALSRFTSREEAGALIARIEQYAGIIDEELAALSSSNSLSEADALVQGLQPTARAFLDEMRTFGDLMNRLSSESLVETRRQLDVTSDTSRYLSYAISAVLIAGLLLAIVSLRAVLRRESALRESNRALARSREIQSSILAAAFNPIVAIDRFGVVFEWNSAAERTFGISRAEILGRPVSDFIVPPQYRAAHKRGLERYLNTGKSNVIGRLIEITALRANGAEFPVELAIAATEIEGEPVFVAQLADITRRMQADAELRESESRLRAVMDHAPLSIVLRDIAGRYLLVNRTWRRWYDPAERSIADRTVHDFFEPEPAKQVNDVIRKAMDTGNLQEVEFENVIADGSVMNTRFYASPITSMNGAVTGVVTFELDVSRHKQLEGQLRQAQRMEAIGQLTGGVAHDFNNLLAIIIGNLELAEERIRDDKAGEMLTTAIAAADRGAALTRQLLAFSRRQALQPEPVDLNDLVRSMEGMLRRALGEAIEIRTRLAPDLRFAMVDRGPLETALLNLAINARDAMPEGGRLTIETRNADRHDRGSIRSVDAEDGGRKFVVISVKDSGHGMSDDVAARAFEPFFTTKSVGKGTGLGLAMVHGFVSQSGGFIDIDSELGRGTTIVLYLPEGSMEEKAVAVLSAPASFVHRAARVLLVEDEPEVRRLVAHQLNELRYSVQVAADASAALDTLRADGAIDLLLTDVVLPGELRGPALVERARLLHRDLAVVYMSGYPEDALTDNATLPPDVILLHKPFRMDELHEALQSALRRTLSAVS